LGPPVDATLSRLERTHNLLRLKVFANSNLVGTGFGIFNLVSGGALLRASHFMNDPLGRGMAASAVFGTPEWA
jgi:hypothetical protein